MHRFTRFVMLVVLLASSCTKNMLRSPAPAASSVPIVNASAPRLPGLDDQAMTPAVRRQIIRNADLSVEADDPGRARNQAIAVAERIGGFAQSTDTVSADHELERSELRVNLLLRVPSDRFEPALGELRALGRGVGREQVKGQDVTEEFIDLEARIRTQRALEAQLLEILKTTTAVSEMMEVHKRLADVRGEIEKMEGRHRYLDDRASLSTIRLEISGPASGRGHGFGDSVRRAKDDVVAIASGIVTGAIRLTGFLLPVLVMIGLPGYAIRHAIRRRRALNGRIPPPIER